MEKGRPINRIKESGIALVTALILTAVILMLIAGVSYLIFRGLSAVIINKQFATVYEAANGGVEHAAGIIVSYWNGESYSELGSYSGNIDSVLQCSSTTDTLTYTIKTADNKYKIEMKIQCLGRQPIPGAGGALGFPPPKGLMGGGTATWFLFYSITASSEETSNPENKGKTEAIYRLEA